MGKNESIISNQPVQLALILWALAVITSCNSYGKESICQGRGEPFNPPEIILSLPKGYSGVLRPQGSILALVGTREKTLPFSSDQLSLLCAPRAVSLLHPTELHQSCPMTNYDKVLVSPMFVFTLALFSNIYAKAQIYNVFRGRQKIMRFSKLLKTRLS